MTEEEKKTLSDLFEAMGKTGAQFQIGQVIGSQTNTYNYYGDKQQEDLKSEDVTPPEQGCTKEEESEEQLYPALRLLCPLVRKAVNEKRSAKYILMPQRAAMEAEVMLPPMDAEWYNRRFGTHLNKMNLSNWLNGTGKSDYDPKELEPMVTRFIALK
jgi:hypothetical protein